MEWATHAALSGWGAATLALLVTFAAAFIWLRGRARVVGGLGLLSAALVCAFLAIDTAAPKVTTAQLHRAADADLMAARAALAWGFNVEARTALDGAEATFRSIGARDGLGRVQIARGDLERLQGRLGEAKTRYAAAAVQLNTVGHSDTPVALLRLGQVEAALGDPAAARRAFAQSIPLFRRFRDAVGEAHAKLADGTLARQGASFADATDLLRDAANLFAEQGDLLGQGRAMLELAQLSQTLVQGVDADARAESAAALFQRAHASFGLALTHLVKADNLVDKEHAEAAEKELNEAVALLESLTEPVGAAAQFLGLPAAERLRVRGGEEDAGANVAAYPDFQIEARTLLSELAARIDRSRWDASRAH